MKSGTSIALGLVMSVSVAVAGGVWTVGNEAHGQGPSWRRVLSCRI